MVLSSLAKTDEDYMQDLTLLAKQLADPGFDIPVVHRDELYRLARKREGDWQGGLSRALSLLTSEEQTHALDAALALAHLVSDPKADQLLAQKNPVPGLLQVLDTLNLADEQNEGNLLAVLVSLLRLVRSTTTGAGHLIAAFGDHNHRVICSAVAFSGLLFADSGLAKRIVEAGFGRALVRVLSNASVPVYCQAAAGVAAHHAALHAGAVEALRVAGLVSAMMGLLGRGPLLRALPEDHPPGRGVLTARFVRPSGWNAAQCPLEDPVIWVCSALLRLVFSSQKIAAEVGAHKDSAAILMQTVSQYLPDDPPVRLLSMVVERTRDRSFILSMLSDHRSAEVISALLDSNSNNLVHLGLSILPTMIATMEESFWTKEEDADCRFAQPVAAALINCIKPDVPYTEMARTTLFELFRCLIIRKKAFSKYSVIKTEGILRFDCAHTLKLVRTLARLMGERAAPEAAVALVILMGYMESKPGDEGLDGEVFAAALSAGFVQGVMRLLSSMRGLSSDLGPVDYPCVWGWAVTIVAFDEGKYIPELLCKGLLDELKWQMSDKPEGPLEGAPGIVCELARHPEFLQGLRHAGIWPELVARLPERCGWCILGDFMTALEDLVGIGVPAGTEAGARAPALVAELMAHGFLDNIKVSSEQKGCRGLQAAIKSLETWSEHNQELIWQFLPAPPVDPLRIDPHEVNSDEAKPP